MKNTTNIHQHCSPTLSLSYFFFSFLFSFTEIQAPHRKESLLLFQLTQSWRKSNLNFYRGCVCLWKSPDYLHCHMCGINWCLGFWGAGYDRETRRDSELLEGHITHISNIPHMVNWTVTAEQKRKKGRPKDDLWDNKRHKLSVCGKPGDKRKGNG